MLILLALVVAVIGVTPFFVARRWKEAAYVGGILTVINWLIFYFGKISGVGPWFGGFGIAASLETIVSATLVGLLEERFPKVAMIPIVAGLLFGGRACTGCSVFRAHDKAAMIGNLEERQWTEDVQPADPAHIRLVPIELAKWLANKQLGKAGSIGSQFEIGSFALQRVKGELWYVAPLDYRGFTAWWSASAAPGYVMISAEDPEREVVIKDDLQFHYSPAAFMGKNLERHLQNNGFRDRGLMDPSLEIDEQGNPWWVVTVYETAFAWSGEKILGVAVVDPSDGGVTYYKVGETPDWIDRVFPASTIHQYIRWWGELREGWINSWWGKHGLLEPEETHLVYGADGDPYWTTAVTSNNEKDQSLVGLIYTDVRTGVSRLYNASGGTDAAIIQSVNNKVSYKRQHGASPVIYNVNGTMASVVPLLGDNHTFQGVAIVSITDPQRVAIGTSFGQALLAYQTEMTKSGQGPGIESAHDQLTVEAKVLRVAQETHDTGVTYRLLLDGQTQIFAAGTELSPELSLTEPGDVIRVIYRTSAESVVPLTGFDNTAITLSAPPPPAEQKP